ncbi:integrase [Allocatelliglobosispora scoriae]|uniref:Integrase n=1 Tax=Allocatelliglobosispora scoriae TaxID=643052 RepID=A0A841BEK6_9ACTN|nr:site-specific integrase [Allocatelliglobosispora scoriae]MBB5866724.1 integrase [Allocatelliglobosispora scoriae]
MPLAVVRDLAARRMPATPEQIELFEVDVLAGFILARASSGLVDSSIRGDVGHLDHVRTWFGRPLWEMEPEDADFYFARVMREAAQMTKIMRAQAITTYFAFLDLRYAVELHALTGLTVQCPIDEMNRPRGQRVGSLRIPPTAAEMQRLFAGWRESLLTCRKYRVAARSYAMARLMEKVGPRVNETCQLDLTDVHWELGRFGKLHIRAGKGSRGSGARQRMTPLINGADVLLRWYIEDIWGLFGDDPYRLRAPLFLSERHNRDCSCMRLTDDGFRDALALAALEFLPSWAGRLTPHVLRHYCASQLYLSGMDLLAVQELRGHVWITARSFGAAPP